MVTLNQVLENAMQLPVEQQEMLIEILHNRHLEQRRDEIAEDARESISAFRAGQIRPQPVEDIILELRQSLNHADDE